tara:strand:- start:260 stop:820 length:561 start_codon:yes stop_codon:yes gene_type:complete
MDNKAIIITGPIGSGKSTALSIIKKLGYNVIDLDEVSGAILTSEESKEFLIENFPTSIVNNEISRKKLADIVFNNKSQLEKLENYLHPKILNNLNEIIKKNEGVTFVEVSAPKNIHKEFQTIIIWSPEEERIKRLQTRGMQLEDIKNRINSQPLDEWWFSIGNLIKNDNLNNLENDIKDLLNALLR